MLQPHNTPAFRDISEKKKNPHTHIKNKTKQKNPKRRIHRWPFVKVSQYNLIPGHREGR